MKKILAFLRSEDGPTAVEYAIMLALILMVCFTAIGLVGQETANSYENSVDQIVETFPEQ